MRTTESERIMWQGSEGSVSDIKDEEEVFKVELLTLIAKYS